MIWILLASTLSFAQVSKEQKLENIRVKKEAALMKLKSVKDKKMTLDELEESVKALINICAPSEE